jgi:hypothetical protein
MITIQIYSITPNDSLTTRCRVCGEPIGIKACLVIVDTAGRYSWYCSDCFTFTDLRGSLAPRLDEG